MARSTVRRRLALALLASLLVHGGALLVLARVRRAAPAPASEPIVFELVQPPVGRPAVGSATPRRESTPTPGGEPAPTRARSAGAAPGHALTQGQPSAPEKPRPSPGSAEWAEAEGLGTPAEGAGAGRPSLVPGALRDGLAAGVGPELAPMRDPALAREAPEQVERKVKARIDAYIADAKAQQRAEFPDAYWSDVRERLERHFDVDWSALDEGRTEKPVVSSGQLKDLLSKYGEAAGRYGGTGSAYENGPDSPGAPAPMADELLGIRPGHGLSGPARTLLDVGRPDNTLWSRNLTALVLVSQSSDGAIVDVQLLQGSGNGAYDRLVLRQAQSLAEDRLKLGPTPPQGRRSLWAFNTQFNLVPPVPVVGCQFDAHFVPTGCFYPLKRTVKSRVQLRAIY